MPVLVAVDALGIQRYVFSSNRLRDMVGGSELVHAATERAELEPLADGLGGRVVASAGGVAHAVFDADGRNAKKDAEGFTTALTRRVAEDCPGLEIAVAHRPYQSGGFAGAMRDVAIDLAHRKAAHRPHAPLPVLPVVEPCALTTLPAVVEDDVPLSRRVQAARTARRGAADEPPQPLTGIQTAWPLELDHLNDTRGDQSLIGVAHVDGNGVGDLIGAWLAECEKWGLPDCVVESAYRDLVDKVDSRVGGVGEAAVAAVGEEIGRERDGHDGNDVHYLGSVDAPVRFRLHSHGEAVSLPIRRILARGDELTFVADARVVFAVAGRILDELLRSPPIAPEAECGTQVPELGALGACAGVAIVGSHYPFSGAYALAAGLCDSAKSKLRLEQRPGPACAIDWHRGAFRPAELADIRARQFGQWLTCRPYELVGSAEPAGPESWEWLTKHLLEGPRGLRGDAWAGSRGKAKALGRIARERGKEATAAQLRAWGARDARLRLPPNVAATGHFRQNGKTPLLDALELLDLRVSL